MTAQPQRTPLNLRLNVKSIISEDSDQEWELDHPSSNPLLSSSSPPPSHTNFENFQEDNEYYSLCTKICNRENMEDRVLVVPFRGGSDAFFGVFDGHTNYYVSEYLQTSLYPKIQSLLKASHQPVSSVMKQAFVETNEELINVMTKKKLSGGSTALVAAIQRNTVTIANVGDCRAYLMNSDRKVKVLTHDHRFTDLGEREHATAKGATVIEKSSNKYYLEGSLSVSRSFGDINYKEYLTVEPEILEFTLQPEHMYLFLASDGFWEAVKTTEELEVAVKYCEKNYTKGSSMKNLSTRLCEYFIEKNLNIPKDNMSLICIDLQYVQTGNTTGGKTALKKVHTLQDIEEMASLGDAFDESLVFTSTKKAGATRGSSLFSFC